MQRVHDIPDRHGLFHENTGQRVGWNILGKLALKVDLKHNALRQFLLTHQRSDSANNGHNNDPRTNQHERPRQKLFHMLFPRLIFY